MVQEERENIPKHLNFLCQNFNLYERAHKVNLQLCINQTLVFPLK